MHRVDKIKFMIFFGEAPQTPCFGYMELGRSGHRLRISINMARI